MKKELRLLAGLCLVSFSHLWAFDNSQVGKEVSIPAHLKDGEELQMPLSDLLALGSQLFQARWTTQEDQGRPLTKGTGNPSVRPLVSACLPTEFRSSIWSGFQFLLGLSQYTVSRWRR